MRCTYIFIKEENKMIKWTREVRPSQKLKALDAFEVNSAVMLIKSALESGIKHFIGSDKGVRIQYANGTAT